jgi:hypothetical protein
MRPPTLAVFVVMLVRSILGFTRKYRENVYM